MLVRFMIKKRIDPFAIYFFNIFLIFNLYSIKTSIRISILNIKMKQIHGSDINGVLVSIDALSFYLFKHYQSALTT